MTVYKIKPFPTNGGQIPALHHLNRNAHKLAWMNMPQLFFKPDKMAIKISAKFNKYLQTINSKAAWQYLKQQTSGVIQNNGKVFQPCIFSTADFAPNTIEIVNTFTYKGVEWGQVECDSVNAPDEVHRYVAEGRLKKDKDGNPINAYEAFDGSFVTLSRAPKASGNVWVPIVSDQPMYIEMNKLITI
jgi:hypothetical protein